MATAGPRPVFERPTATVGGRHRRRALGVAEPAQEIVGRELGDPAPAGRAVFQVLADRLGRGVVELAQAIGLQGLVGRVSGGGGTHGDLLVEGKNAIGERMTKKERPLQAGDLPRKNQNNPKSRRLPLITA